MALMNSSHALQREVWLFDPDPEMGNELGKKIRPAIIISSDFMNKGPSGLIFIVPITSVAKGIRSHVPIIPPEGGLSIKSFALCEQARSVSVQRLIKRLGEIKSKETLLEIRSWILDFINLDM